MSSTTSFSVTNPSNEVERNQSYENPVMEIADGAAGNSDSDDSVHEASISKASDPPAYEDGEAAVDSPGPRTLNVGDDLEIHENKFVKVIVAPITKIGLFLKKHSSTIEKIVLVTLALFYIGYMIAALILNFDEAIPLLVIFCLVVFFQVYAFLRDTWGDEIWEVWKPVYDLIGRNMYWIKWVVLLIALVLLGVFIALDVADRPQQIISFAGYVIFIVILWLFASKFPAKVRWRPVFWGFAIQIVLAALILRVDAVFQFFNWLGEFARKFLDFVDAGSIFLFGDLYYQHYFAFKVLPIIIYFSSFISVMYYVGAMQWLIYKIAWLMQFTLGTSGTESMCAAGNIFVGQTESPLLIRPYLKDVTTSELFAIMTAGFGTIAGSVLGAYLGFGIKAVYVITACVMAAPCALALAKLMYPETKVSKFRKLEGLALDPPDQRNIIEAAFVGASTAIPLVLNIGANLIAFISLLAALNGFLGWYGGLLNYPELSFETICSYVFMPVTYLMGIEWIDCFKCAELLGTKIFLNEFIAYEELSRLIDNKDSGILPKEDANGTINWLNDKSEAIITYALCGFANVGSLGIMLGGLGAMCPERQKEMAKIVIRALIAGIFVSILNASISGFFYLPNPNCTTIYQAPFWNGTVEITSLYSCCGDTVTEVQNSDVLNTTILEYDRCCNFNFPLEYEPLDCS